MSSIHRIILYRLLAAWVVICLIIGLAVSWAGLRKIDRQLVTMATGEMRKFAQANLNLLTQPETARRLLDQVTASLAHNHYIAGEFQDAGRRRLADAVNPLHAMLKAAVDQEASAFPLDLGRQFREFSADGHKAMRVLVPLADPAGRTAAYFEGAFLVDPDVAKILRDDLALTLLVTLLTVTLTTVCFYPIILGLNRSTMRHSQDLLAGNIELMEVVGSAIAKRDSNTSAHNYRVATYAVKLGEAIGLGGSQMRDLIAGAFLHDVGKIGVADSVLLKRGALETEEFEQMKRHVSLGVDILTKSKWLLRAREVVEFHHERYDGSGYPKGLVGEQIPLLARIFAVVDVFDALTSVRPYKEALSLNHAMMVLRAGAGKLFDPALAARFETIAETLYGEMHGLPDAEIERRLQQAIARYFAVTN